MARKLPTEAELVDHIISWLENSDQVPSSCEPTRHTTLGLYGVLGLAPNSLLELFTVLEEDFVFLGWGVSFDEFANTIFGEDSPKYVVGDCDEVPTNADVLTVGQLALVLRFRILVELVIDLLIEKSLTAVDRRWIGDKSQFVQNLGMSQTKILELVLGVQEALENAVELDPENFGPEQWTIAELANAFWQLLWVKAQTSGG